MVCRLLFAESLLYYKFINGNEYCREVKGVGRLRVMNFIII